MPWKLKGNCVYKENADKSLGKLVKCHKTRAQALAHMRALYVNVKEADMTSKTTKDKRRQRRIEKAKLHKEAQELLEEEDLELDDPEMLDEEGEEGAVEKELYSKQELYAIGAEQAMPMMGGPTSWEQYEEQELAHEKAEKVREMSWTVQDLVYNIVNNPTLNPEEKANSIKAVGDGFGMRVQGVMDSASVEKELDVEVLEAEAMIAKDLRQTGLIEKGKDWLEKKKLSYGEKKAMGDSSYALVYTDKDGNKVRKYLIHDKAHVRNALARAAQQIKAGGAGAADARRALPKIKAAAKRMGIGMEKERGSILIEKDKNDQYRAIMWPTNRWVDWDGEILSDAAHKEYVTWVKENMDCAPVFVTKHIPGTRRESQVDFVDYVDGQVLMSAPLTDSEAAGFFRVMKETDIGLSHGSWALARDKNDRKIITKYRMYEVSDLPKERAANPFTDLAIKEADMDTKEYLAAILGSEELAEKFLEKSGMKQKALDDAGVKSAEKSEEETPQEVQPEQTPAAPAMDMAEIVKQVKQELDVDGLSETIAKLKEDAEKVPVLEALVKELSAKRDDELAEMIQPPITKNFSWSAARPSQSKENVLKNEDEITKVKPQVGWLNEVTGTTPLN